MKTRCVAAADETYRHASSGPERSAQDAAALGNARHLPSPLANLSANPLNSLKISV
jgi:hypothetical protein